MSAQLTDSGRVWHAPLVGVLEHGLRRHTRRAVLCESQVEPGAWSLELGAWHENPVDAGLQYLQLVDPHS